MLVLDRLAAAATAHVVSDVQECPRFAQTARVRPVPPPQPVPAPPPPPRPLPAPDPLHERLAALRAMHPNKTSVVRLHATEVKDMASSLGLSSNSKKEALEHILPLLFTGS